MAKRSFSVFLTAILWLLAAIAPAQASTTWQIGDVFAGVGNGSYNVYSNTGVFKETISDGTGGFTTGCSFNATLDKLYTTNFMNNTVVVYNDASPHTIAQTIDTTLQSGTGPESIVFAANGDFYVGHANPNEDIQRYNAAGTYQQSYDVATDDRGSDWIDLAADQKTMYYTSEGRRILRYDVSTSAQLTDFATLPADGAAYALRLLPPGDGTGGLLVAQTANVKRLDGSGAVVQTYDVAGEDSWFALNRDPNGTSFWAGDFGTNNFYRFNLATGAIEVGPINTGGSLFGLCLKGEITAAVGNIVLTPPTAQNQTGTSHTVTATVTSAGSPVPGELVSLSVTAGPNTGQVSNPGTGECTVNSDCTTAANGQVSWTYTSNGTAGTDTIQACFDEAGTTKCATASKEWIGAGPPATLVLTPATDTNTVDDQHCVTATVRDAAGNPTPGITVRFSVSVSVTTSGSAVTNAAGQATFCYTGPGLPGGDLISAYADTDGDNVNDADEPEDTATKTWIIPANQMGCKVTYGGRITAANGDKATFGGNAKGAGPAGQEEYQDHGPAAAMNVHSIDVDAVTCSTDGTKVSIFGTATINGAGTFDYRIDLKDPAGPGPDTYRIRLSNGYDSGEQPLRGGNVQIH